MKRTTQATDCESGNCFEDCNHCDSDSNQADSKLTTTYLEANFTNIKDNEGNRIFDIQLLTKFIHRISVHAATFKAPFNLKSVDKKHSAGMIMSWS